MSDEVVVPQPELEDVVGVPDGTVLPNGDKVVYDKDEAGKFVGWHKENASPHPVGVPLTPDGEKPSGEEQAIIPDPNTVEESANG